MTASCFLILFCLGITGKAIARPYYYFKKLMKKCNIDCTKHVWHDLRHTYATLLDQNNMNMKVVSEILGHYSEEFTNEVLCHS